MTHTDDIEHATINRFVDLNGKKVLEVGCGDGRLTAFIAQKADNLIAIDTDKHQVKTAKARVVVLTLHSPALWLQKPGAGGLMVREQSPELRLSVVCGQ